MKFWLRFDSILLAIGLVSTSPMAFAVNQCESVFKESSVQATIKSKISTIDPFTSFPESRYGLSDSSRKGHAHFAKWAANLTMDLLKLMDSQQIRPQELFSSAMNERIQFAETFEGMENPAREGFGELRVKLGKHEQGEERVGVSSIGLDLQPTNRPPRDYEYPEVIWQRFAKISSRIEIANAVLRSVVEVNNLKMDSSQNEAVLDRYYQTLDGQQIKLAGTKLKRLADAEANPSYLVSLLNAPKSNVDIIMKDVYERISIVLSSQENTEANREHLTRAMQGYFCAMPYYRGSGAVGRIVFTALFSSLNRQQVTLHPEVDIKALSLEYGAFKNSFELSHQESPGKLTGKLQSFKARNKVRSIFGAVKRFLSF